jgi:hypothetical protein
MSIDTVTLVCAVAKQLRQTGKAQINAEWKICEDHGEYYVEDDDGNRFDLDPENTPNSERAVREAFFTIYGHKF